MVEIMGNDGSPDYSRIDDKIHALEEVIGRAALVEDGITNSLRRLDERIATASQLKLDLEGLQQTIIELSEKSRNTDKEVSSFRERTDRDIRNVEDEIKKASESIRLMNTQVEQGKSTLGRLDKTEQQLLQLERSLKESERVRQELSSAAGTVQDFLRHRVDAEKAISNLQTTLNQSVSSIGDLEQRANQVSSAIEQKAQSASSRLDDLLGKLDEISSRTEQLPTLRDELESFKPRIEEISHLVGPLTDLNRQVDELSGRVVTMQGNMNNLESAKSQLEALVDDLSKATVELTALMGQMDKSRDTLDRVEKLQERLSEMESALSEAQKIRSDLDTISTNLQDYNTRWGELEQSTKTQQQIAVQLTSDLDSLQKQAELFKARQENEENTALERSNKISAQLNEVEQLLPSVLGLQAQIDQSRQNLVELEAKTEPLSSIVNRVDELGAQLTGFEKTCQDFQTTIIKAESDRTSIEEHLVTSGTHMMDLAGKVESVTSAVDGLNVELQKVSDKCALYADVADRADKLDITIEFIKAKLTEIMDTKSLVETASSEHSRLNAMLWEMDGRMRKLKQEQELLQSSEGNLARVESILDSISQKESQIKDLSDLIAKANSSREALNGVLGLAEENRKFLETLQATLPVLEQKSTEIKAELDALEVKQSTLSDEQDRLRMQGLDLERQRVDLDQVAKLAIEVPPLKQSLQDLEVKAQDITNKVDGLAERLQVLGTTDLKLNELEQKLKIIIDRSATLRQELNRLENMEKEIDRFDKSHLEFIGKAEAYEDRAGSLVGKMTDIDEQLARRQNEIHTVFDDIVKRITEIKTIESNISVLEEKSTRLMQMREELDRSLTATIDRSAAIDRYHIRLDNFKIMVDELSSRIERVVKEIPRLDDLEKELTALFAKVKDLGVSIGDSTQKIGVLTSENQEIQNKYKQLFEIRASFDSEMKQVEAKHKEMVSISDNVNGIWKEMLEKAKEGEKAQEQLRVYEDRMGAISFLYDDINYRFGEINRIATRLKTLEDNMAKVDGYLDLLKMELSKINEEMGKVDTVASSITAIDEKSGEIQGRFKIIEHHFDQLEKSLADSEDIKSQIKQLGNQIEERRAELISLEGIEAKITELRSDLSRTEERAASIARGSDRLEAAFRKIAMLSMALDAIQSSQQEPPTQK